MRRAHLLVAMGLASLFAGCSSGGGGGSLPVARSTDPVAASTLQFAVGTARFAQTGGTGSYVGLNVVETLRQANGLSGVLFDVPTITGPTSFAVAPAAPDNSAFNSLVNQDFGTNRITSASLGPAVGALGYGLCACNANAPGATPYFTSLPQPLFETDPQIGQTGGQLGLPFYGGPPAFPTTRDGTYAAGFLGYALGFTAFNIVPVTGTYRLDVAVPPDFTTPVNATTPTLSKSAVLTQIAGLPPYPMPSPSPDGSGGAAFQIAPPAGVTESLVQVAVSLSCVSPTTPIYYSILARGSGPQTVVLPAQLGPVLNGNSTPSLCRGSNVRVYAVGFDYPAFEAAYPASTSVTPTITGANGQADVTVSPYASFTAP